MKRGQILEVFIEDTKYPSIGIAKVENKTIEIKNAIVGAKVLVRITKNRKEKAEGKILEVLQYPEESIEPICPHSEECGGCSHQRIPYETQLRQKEREVLKLFEDAGIKGFKYEGIEKSPLEFEYRNKMEFTFGNLTKGGEMTLGMHQSGKFYNIIPIEQCKIADNDYNIILRAVSDYCRRKELPFYNKMNHEGYLRYLVIRKSFRRKELLVNIITTTQMEHDFTELADELLKLELDNTLVGFLHTKNDSLSDTVKNEGYSVLYGRDYIVEEILGLQFKISAFSFFQTNSLGAEKLYSVVQDYLGDAEGKVVYDLYCGTGTITQVVSQKADKIYGIELIEEAIEAAKENVKLNNIDNIEFIVGDVGEKLKEIEEKPDLIIIDPPRPGVGKKALQQIIDYGVPQMVYVSCNPKTLVENLKDMIEAGYKVERMKLVDMFPHTAHVECVVLMTNVKNK
ncbi:MAG: 23S rRNA (uracil(1939)-C(5))-methyltransferase RlmD [Clostridiales bacterium]|nr:23S rRNA (uracil(1939)-C(5))-methyltransferase RlmD [Clostridiales bacterium]